jgi:hypothetical protein
MSPEEKTREITVLTGTVNCCEFVEYGDDEERDPGTYLTIRLDNERAIISAGRVRVSWFIKEPTSGGHDG